jgi:hypothetical protein
MTGDAFQGSRDLRHKTEKVLFVEVLKVAARWRLLTESAHSAVVDSVEVVFVSPFASSSERLPRSANDTGAFRDSSDL